MSSRQVVYNETIKIILAYENHWLKWMKSFHIPEMMKTGCFISGRLNRVLHLDEAEGKTYTIQYVCENGKKLDQFLDLHALKIQNRLKAKFIDQHVSFRSVMEVYDEF